MLWNYASNIHLSRMVGDRAVMDGAVIDREVVDGVVMDRSNSH